jgi:hypothetical protein
MAPKIGRLRAPSADAYLAHFDALPTGAHHPFCGIARGRRNNRWHP